MITTDPIHPAEHLGDLAAGSGAVVSFSGVVRDRAGERRVTGIYYECYREMAEAEIRRIRADIERRHSVHATRVVHRVGEVPAGELSVLAVVVAAHRAEAFAACQSLVDEIKKRLPVWKKERYGDGTSRWL